METFAFIMCRLLNSPSVALDSARAAIFGMAMLVRRATDDVLDCIKSHDPEKIRSIRKTKNILTCWQTVLYHDPKVSEMAHDYVSWLHHGENEVFNTEYADLHSQYFQYLNTVRAETVQLTMGI